MQWDAHAARDSVRRNGRLQEAREPDVPAEEAEGDGVRASSQYRCQFCGLYSIAKSWKKKRGKDGDERCPKCGKPYDTRAAILAQEGDD
jgi:hypothetical protein